MRYVVIQSKRASIATYYIIEALILNDGFTPNKELIRKYSRKSGSELAGHWICTIPYELYERHKRDFDSQCYILCFLKEIR